MTKEELKELIFNKEDKERYGNFTLLDEPVPFDEFAKDKNIDCVQPHTIISFKDKTFITWAGSFGWKNNELNSLDGDYYNKSMKVFGYEWFENEEMNIECGLDIIVDNF